MIFVLKLLLFFASKVGIYILLFCSHRKLTRDLVSPAPPFVHTVCTYYTQCSLACILQVYMFCVCVCGCVCFYFQVRITVCRRSIHKLPFGSAQTIVVFSGGRCLLLINPNSKALYSNFDSTYPV